MPDLRLHGAFAFATQCQSNLTGWVFPQLDLILLDSSQTGFSIFRSSKQRW